MPAAPENAQIIKTDRIQINLFGDLNKLEAVANQRLKQKEHLNSIGIGEVNEAFNDQTSNKADINSMINADKSNQHNYKECLVIQIADELNKNNHNNSNEMSESFHKVLKLSQIEEIFL